jgi:zinc/manganese transport system permease protein
MTGMLELLAAPFVACLVLTGIHCYLGIHVVQRGVIFVDLSLAQIAALGTAVALLFGYEFGSTGAYHFSLVFTFIGAAIFALWRFGNERIPQEALIGIVYAVASAGAILVLDKAPHGHEEIKAMLVGNILWVTWSKVIQTAVIYAVIGALHFFLRRKFFAISEDEAAARKAGIKVWLWDFVFYATFGIVVTSSVQIAGVLLVFSYLVVPAVIAIMFHHGIMTRLVMGWIVGTVVSIAGIWASVTWDLPTGAAIVATFGVALIIAAATKGVIRLVGIT